MKIVVDCNVVISAGITDGVCARVVQSVISSYTWIVSRPILEEYEEVCRRARFQRYHRRLTPLLTSIVSVASLVDDPEKLPLDLPDPDDAIYLEAACAGKADILITGNSKHFPSAFRGIQILTPRDFLNLSPSGAPPTNRAPFGNKGVKTRNKGKTKVKTKV